MADKTTAYDGQPDGTVATQGTGGNAGVDVINKSGGESYFSDAAAVRGPRGIRMVQPASGYVYHVLQYASAVARIGTGFFWTHRVPSADDIIAVLRPNSGLSAVLYATTDGRIAAGNAGATKIAASQSPVLDVGAKYWVAAAAKPGTSTTTGTIELTITRVSDGVVVHTWSAANVNANTTNPIHVRLGRNGAASIAFETLYDDFTVSDRATGLVEMPTVAATGATVTAVTATATAAAAAPVVDGTTAVTGGGPAALTATAPAPTVTTGGTAAAVPATAAASATAPAVTAGTSTVATPATATGLLRPPSVTGSTSGTVQAVRAQATAGMPQAVVTAGQTTPAARATASMQAPTPAVTGGAAIITPRTTTTAAAPAPAVTSGATISPSSADTVLELPAPAVVHGTTSIVPVTTAALVALVPTVHALPPPGPPRDIKVVVGPVRTDWLTAPLAAHWGAASTAVHPIVAAAVTATPVTAAATTASPAAGLATTGHLLQPRPVTASAWAGLPVYLEET